MTPGSGDVQAVLTVFACPLTLAVGSIVPHGFPAAAAAAAVVVAAVAVSILGYLFLSRFRVRQSEFRLAARISNR